MLKDKIEVTEDRSLAKVTLASKAFTAKEMEELIDRLSRARAQMLPEVSREAPELKPGDWMLGVSKLALAFSVDTRQTVLRIRNIGAGWQNFALSPEVAASLANYVSDLHVSVARSGVMEGDGSKH